MSSRARGVHHNQWDQHDDYNTSLYDTQYPDEDINGGVELDHCRLYITNISKVLSEDGLRAAFEKFGTLLEVHLNKDPHKRYALVRYQTPGEARFAMTKLNRTEPLRLTISIAHKTKLASRPNQGRKERAPAPNREEWGSNRDERGSNRDERGSNRGDSNSISSRGRQSRKQEEPVNGDDVDEELEDEDFGYTELDPNLHLELETLKLQQLKLQEEQLMCKHRMLLLRQADKKPVNQVSNRCILPDGKIVVRNVSERATEPEASFSTSGDSNQSVCSCKARNWEQSSEEASSTPSTCVLCSDDRSQSRRDKSVKLVEKQSQTTKVTDFSSLTRDQRSKGVDSASKHTDATSKKEMKRCCKCRSEVTCDLKYSEFYSDSEDEDETNRLIQLRNSDYLDIVDDHLKVVIALAGYPKSKIRLREMEVFQRCLSDVIDMQLKAGLLQKVPSFLDYYLNRGALVCICKDDDTRDWIVRVSPGLQERMCTNLVLLKARVKRLCLAVLKIPKQCWPASANDAFKLLQYFNPTLRTNMWKIYSQKTLDDVEITSFLIDRISGEIIRGPFFKNVIDYGQMEFELTGYTEIYHECILSGMEEDLRSVSSRVKLLEALKSAQSTPRILDAGRMIESAVVLDAKNAKVDEKGLRDNEKEELIVVKDAEPEKLETSDKKEEPDYKRELESSLQRDVLKKLKDVQFISDTDEVLVWADETRNFQEDTEKGVADKDHLQESNVASVSGVAISDKTESIAESNDNLIARSSNLNIDSNRGIAYHRRTNYLHVDNELKVAITLEGYPQHKLEGTHIRRLKHLYKEYLHKEMKNQRFANLIIPKFQDVYLSNGAVIYICDSLETKDYLTEVLPKFINSTGLKLTFRDIKCLVRYTRIVMRLPKEYAHVESVEILLKLQSRYPGLKPDCWKYYSDVAGKQKRQFGVDPESLEVIKNPDFDPTYDGEKITFRIIDRQKRDVSFDEASKELDDGETKRQRDTVTKHMYVPVDPELHAAPLTRIRTNHYSELIADDLKLYVGPSDYPETRIDEAQFHNIKRTFENIVIDAMEEDLDHIESTPKLHDMYLFDGVIFIICQNMATRIWIENAIPSINAKLNLNLKSTEFRGAVGIISMVARTQKDTDEVIAILQKQNPRLRTKYWRKISTVRTNTKLDVVLQIDKLSAEVISSRKFNKMIDKSAVQFKLGHLQSLLRPKKSLDELTVIASQTPEITEDPHCGNTGTGDAKEDIKIEDPVEIITNKEDDVFLDTGDAQEDSDPVLERDSPKSRSDFVLPDRQDFTKVILTIPLNILPDNEDDLNIIFDLLEDKNPGLNTELWQVYMDNAYPNNGRFIVYVDKQSLCVIRRKNFDPTMGGEILRFYY